MDEELDDDNMTSEGDEGGQEPSSSEGNQNPSKVKSAKDRARRFGKSAQEFGEKIGKLVQTLMKGKGKIVVGVIIVVVIIFLAMIWVAAEEEETEEAVKSIEEVATNGTGTLNFSNFYQKTGSLLMATDSDIDEIYDTYIEEIEKINNPKAKAFKKKYFNGDKSNTTELNKLKPFYKHVLNAEKYNFNRIEWRAFKREDLVKGGEPTDKIDMQTDSDTGLKYPKYEGTLYASSELEYYTNALYPYMQSWIIPLAMTTGTTSGGLTETSPEGEAGDSDDSYNTRFGYEIMASGYHKLKYDRFEVYTRTKRDSYKEYDEGITSGTVDRVCTVYSIGLKDDGTYVDPSSAEATSIQTSGSICVDSNINYGTETVTPIVEFPTSMPASEYNIQKYYEDNKMNAANPATVKTNSSLKSEDLGDKSDYQYDVTSYEGFDFKIEKEYTFTPYDLTKQQNIASESSSPFTTEEVYQGKSASGIKYTPKNDTAPAWTSSIYAKGVTTTTKVNVTKKTQNGATYTVEREWADELEIVDVQNNTYELTDLETFVGDSVSTQEQIYYGDIITDDGGLNIIDLINAKPDIYEKYLEKDQNISEYLGYSRDYLELSYYLLGKYMVKLAEEHKANFMWGNTVVPSSVMIAYGSGALGETLLVTNANIIYPLSNADIGKTVLKDNFVTSIGGRAVYGYNSEKFGPHTGIDISLKSGERR